ncbi:MAG TPA: hypothetical protein VFU13_12690 [Steroidobacteraceae bacterium]|nr:hypothetical protein [Steroidobacteraceae bacterium]
MSDREDRLPYRGWWPFAGGALIGLTLRLIFRGDPGDAYTAMMGSFILGSPVLVAVITVYIAELQARRSWSYYFVAPALANVLYVLGTLLILIEGWVCAIIILPLFCLVGGIAGLAMGAICRATHWPRRAVVGCVAMLPLLTGGLEQRLALPARERVAEREIMVAADAARVWRELVDVHQIAPAELDDAWLYRIGVPLPVAGAAETRDGAHLRHMTMGKGIRFDQVATEWRENEQVTWRNLFSADSFPAGALDDHVRIGGHYFDVRETQYGLREIGGQTRLRIRMSYRVSTRFNWYAGPVADLLVGNFAEVALRFYARRAELAAGNQAPAAS